MPPQQQSNVFGGQRASYVALAAISTLALALLSSIWSSDVSGSTALLGLLAVYLASNELLTLYVFFTPASIIVDIIRLSLVPHSVGGRGWLVFFEILGMVCKAAGTLFAWSLQRSMSSGGQEGYAPMAAAAEPTFSVDDPFAAAPAYDGRRPQGQGQGPAAGAAGGQLYVPPPQPPAAPAVGNLV